MSFPSHPQISAALLLLLFSLLTSLKTAAAEGKLVAKSSELQVKVLELYSSEGCSSCPPAERWFSSLESHPNLWKTFVPLQIHVDYWDGLGWPDIFAKPEFIRRQREYAAEWQAASVYTPEFVLDGKESSRPGTTELSAAGEARPGVLELWKVSEDTYRVVFRPVRDTAKNLSVTLALLGSGIRKEVEAGENANEVLQHDFLVLETAEMMLQKREEAYEATLKMPSSQNSTQANSLSIAAWVRRKSSLAPIQAVAAPLS